MWEWALGPLFFMTILENSPPFGGGERSDPLKKITELVAELAAPAAEEAGCSLWDVEYVREGGTWYLRIYIDKPGGVDILDCETVSRAVEPLLDEADPIQGSYTFEVSSAGCDRVLRTAEHFAACMGQEAEIKLYRPRNGRKEFVGILQAYDDGNITIIQGEAPITFEKKEVALARLYPRF